jgi:RNA polymerase sigma factor (sigma-70 family)
MEMLTKMTAKEFAKLQKMMLRSAKYYLKSDVDAEEVVSIVLEKLALGKFNVASMTELEKVLKTVIRFASFDMMRSRSYKMYKQGRIISMDAVYVQVTERTYDTDTETREALYVLLDNEMSSLTEVDIRLIQMKYMDGHSYEEIAGVLGGNARSLCVRAGRILQKLEQRMQLKMCA